MALITPNRATEAYRSPISNTVLYFALFMLSDRPTAPVRASNQLAYGIVATAGAGVLELIVHDQSFLIIAPLAANVLAASVLAVRHQATPPLRALGIQPAALSPLALVIWLASGPLGGRVAPPVAVVRAAQTTGSTSGAVRSGEGRTKPVQAQPFQAQVTGTVRQAMTVGGRVRVDVRLSVAHSRSRRSRFG